MSLVTFPSNPTNGMIFEITPGLYYKYSAGTKSWVRIDGVSSLGLATPIANGLMSKADYSKLQTLLIPPIQTTLAGEDCDSAFRSGIVALKGGDNFVNVSPDLALTGQDGVTTLEPWQLHKNTGGFNFTIDLENLVSEIEDRKQLTRVRLQGKQGPDGEDGDPGIDRLDTGPVGDQGTAGSNSSFAGTLIDEGIPFEKISQENRAIVDITTEEVSASENYLVVTRANIGNPDACPTLVIPKDFQSSLLVVLNQTASKFVRDESVPVGDCALICRICASALHHLNVDPIITEIADKFTDRVRRLKLAKEELLLIWLKGMVTLFNEQKSALCCALENCLSRKRNQSTRQYIESQRIQAAAGGYSITVDGRESKVLTDMDAAKNCPVAPSVVSNVENVDCGVNITLDSRIHTVDPRSGSIVNQAVTAYLPAGSYVAQITSCCANFNQSVVGNKYSGRAAILYRQDKSIGSGADERSSVSEQVVAFPDFGTFATESAAKNAYQNVTLSFEHAGGDVTVWLVDPDGFTENNDGKVIVNICTADSSSTDLTAAASNVYVYRGSVQPDNLIGRISPFSSGITAEANLGLDTDQNINLTVGPSLADDRISTFFFNGTDGFHFYLVAGNNPYYNTLDVNQNDTAASIQLRITVTNNSLPVAVTAVKGTVQQLSTSEFVATLNLEGDAAGFAIGSIDGDSDYAINVEPIDFDTMREWYAVDSDTNLLLSEGSTSGIGAGTSVVRNPGSVTLYDLDDVPEGYGELYGLSVINELSQSVYISRPVDVTVVGSRPREVDDPRDLYEGDDPRDTPEEDTPGLTPGEEEPPALTPPTVPTDTPRSVPPDPEKPASQSECELEKFGITKPTGTVSAPGTQIPPTSATVLADTSGVIVAQDSSIADIVITASVTDLLSARYILTDFDGNKYFSDFIKIPQANIIPGTWEFISFGPPVSALAPPSIFTSAVIREKTIDVNLAKTLLTREQFKKAASLSGLSRLTFIQSILGTVVNAVADANEITDFEIQLQQMGAASISIGDAKMVVGRPGTTLEYTIDDFTLSPVPVTADDSKIVATIKREVARVSGPDNSVNGALYSGLTSYYGDYNGFDTFYKRGVDFSGNNFFSVNASGATKVSQITDARGFRDLTTGDGEVGQATASGSYSGDGIVTDLFGIVYIADGASGYIGAWVASNAGINNTTFGDANDLSSNSFVIIASDLPTTTRPVITLGRLKMSGQTMVQELICNFGGSWFTVDGFGYTLFGRGPAARDDVTTYRCCFGSGNNAGSARMVAIGGGIYTKTSFGSSFGGNSIATNRDIGPQPSIPVPSSSLKQFNIDAIQTQLDSEFNLNDAFTLYSLDGDKIYTINQSNGSRTLYRDLGQVAFGLRVNPVTKDLYYVVNDRGTDADLPSGTTIKRVDVDNIDSETGLPAIRTVWVAENEGIFGIQFGNVLPSDTTLSNAALYALLSTLVAPDSNTTVTTRLVEIAETAVPPPPGPELDARVPTNGPWVGSGDGGIAPGGPGSNANNIIFTKITPGDGCQMYYKQVQWYERGWRIGACCGALVKLGSDYWIVVKRSIGIDISCGGGESENTPCIQQYLDSGEGHPAIAWPTLPPTDSPPGGGGDEFLGLPTSGFVNFTKDDALSITLLNAITNGQALMIKGNPATEIPFVLFPASA